MQIVDFVKNLPTSIQGTWHKVTAFGQTKHEWLVNYWQTKQNEYAEHHFWKRIRPFYIRNIQPLDRWDGFLAGGSLVAASLVTTVSWVFFGPLLLPPTAGLGTLIFIKTFSLSRSRIEKRFNDDAFEHVKDIRSKVYNINYQKYEQNQHFTEIEALTEILNEPQFSHLQEDIKNMSEEIRKYKGTVSSASEFQKKYEVVKAHFMTLKTFARESRSDIAKLESEIDKVEQNIDVELIEMYKQKLNESPNEEIRRHIPELSNQIEELKKEKNEVKHFIEAKKTLCSYLKTLLKKLSPHQPIEEFFQGPQKSDLEIKEEKKQIPELVKEKDNIEEEPEEEDNVEQAADSDNHEDTFISVDEQ